MEHNNRESTRLIWILFLFQISSQQAGILFSPNSGETLFLRVNTPNQLRFRLWCLIILYKAFTNMVHITDLWIWYKKIICYSTSFFLSFDKFNSISRALLFHCKLCSQICKEFYPNCINHHSRLSNLPVCVQYTSSSWGPIFWWWAKISKNIFQSYPKQLCTLVHLFC